MEKNLLGQEAGKIGRLAFESGHCKKVCGNNKYDSSNTCDNAWSVDTLSQYGCFSLYIKSRKLKDSRDVIFSVCDVLFTDSTL